MARVERAELLSFKGARKLHLADTPGSGHTLCGKYPTSAVFRGYADDASRDEIDRVCSNCLTRWSS